MIRYLIKFTREVLDGTTVNTYRSDPILQIYIPFKGWWVVPVIVEKIVKEKNGRN